MRKHLLLVLHTIHDLYCFKIRQEYSRYSIVTNMIFVLQSTIRHEYNHNSVLNRSQYVVIIKSINLNCHENPRLKNFLEDQERQEKIEREETLSNFTLKMMLDTIFAYQDRYDHFQIRKGDESTQTQYMKNITLLINSIRYDNDNISIYSKLIFSLCEFYFK